MTARAPELRILVCGTADRGDDGAPLVAITHLLPELPGELRGRLEIRRCPQLDAVDVMDVGEGMACVVIDTVIGVEPGAVVTMALAELARR
ncbi:MAG: hypothetical protein HY264_07280, partial [Chloroflexi bacterium]|nr:hypothetical protein [Chloroflexota bacterium]